MTVVYAPPRPQPALAGLSLSARGSKPRARDAAYEPNSSHSSSVKTLLLSLIGPSDPLSCSLRSDRNRKLAPDQGPPGGLVTATGTGWVAGHRLRLPWSDANARRVLATDPPEVAVAPSPASGSVRFDSPSGLANWLPRCVVVPPQVEAPLSCGADELSVIPLLRKERWHEDLPHEPSTASCVRDCSPGAALCPSTGQYLSARRPAARSSTNCH